MSGEAVVGLTVVGSAALFALAGTAAGAGCALVVGGGLTLVGTAMERRELRRRAAAMARSALESVALEVAVRNARIATLRSATDALPVGTRPALPKQLVLGDQTVEALTCWCGRTDEVLAAAETDVARLTARDLLARILSEPEVLGPSLRIDDLLAASSGPFAPPAPPAPSAGRRQDPGPESVREDLVRVVSRLAPDAPAIHRAAVEAAAAKVADAVTRIEALNWLTEVRHRIEQADKAAERVRQDALAAALLLQPLAQSLPGVAAGGDTDDGFRAELRRALVDVVAGRRPLEPWMRTGAVRAAEELKRAADRWYVRKTVVETLDELGYTVDEGFQTGVPVNGTLRLVRNEWTAHGVRLRLDDETGTLTAMVVRTEASQAWDAGRQDVERQREWCVSLDVLRDRLREQGVEYAVSSLVEPGRHTVPLVATGPKASRPVGESVRRRLGPPGAPSS